MFRLLRLSSGCRWKGLRPNAESSPNASADIRWRPVADNDGNVGGSLRGDVEAECVARQNAVDIPANPNVTKLERSGNAATHFEGTVALVVESAVNALSLASGRSSIRAVRPALHARRPPNAAERKLCL
jgi:hypothetical protein